MDSFQKTTFCFALHTFRHILKVFKTNIIIIGNYNLLLIINLFKFKEYHYFAWPYITRDLFYFCSVKIQK